MRKRIVHAAWAAREGLCRAYDRHCEDGGDRTFGYVFAAVAAVCVAASPWHPHQIIMAVPAGLMAAAILTGEKKEGKA